VLQQGGKVLQNGVPVGDKQGHSGLEDLSDSGFEEFGAGTELSRTGFLILGLLTFWIYTVWAYYKILEDHLRVRLEYFKELSTQSHSSHAESVVEEITRTGFQLKSSRKIILIGCYFVSMALIIGLLAYKYFTGSLDYRLDQTVVGVAAALFCIAGIFFLYSVSQILKSHEYYELLFLNLVSNPEGFKIVQPSSIFVRRWNRNQASIALFLIISIPLTISPFVGVQHYYALMESNSPWLDIVGIGWVALLLVCAAVFHVWGTGLLVNMYNEHMRIEAINKGHAVKESGWVAAQSNSVLGKTESVDSAPAGQNVFPERVLAAIMVTDMVGFSRDMEMNEQQTCSKLLKHNEIIRNNLELHRGRELKTMGDSFLVRFNSAVDAVSAAIDIQEDFSKYNQNEHDDDKILVRIGIHIGDVLIMGEDIIGSGVNVAARIEPLAEPGGICISADVYNLVRKSVDVKVLSLGKQELKNIRDVPELYKIVLQSVTSNAGSPD
jgi:class 3 adenylate cyclase